MALVGISSITSLIIGLVLYYFAQDRLVHAENTLLKQRSQTANAGAQDFLEGLRDPQDKTLPPPSDYAEELVRAVADPTGLEVLYVGPDMEPLAARDGLGNPLDPSKAYGRLDKADLKEAASSPGGEGRLVWSEGHSGYVAVWPLTAYDGTVKGVLVYHVPRDELGETLAYLRYGILGAILTSILLAGAASLLLTRRVTRPLSETRDAAIRVASGDYAADRARQEQGRARRGSEDFQLHGRGDRALRRGDPGAKEPSGGSPRSLSRGCCGHGLRRAGYDGQRGGGQDAWHKGL